MPTPHLTWCSAHLLMPAWCLLLWRTLQVMMQYIVVLLPDGYCCYLRYCVVVLMLLIIWHTDACYALPQCLCDTVSTVLLISTACRYLTRCYLMIVAHGVARLWPDLMPLRLPRCWICYAIAAVVPDLVPLPIFCRCALDCVTFCRCVAARAITLLLLVQVIVFGMPLLLLCRWSACYHAARLPRLLRCAQLCACLPVLRVVPRVLRRTFAFTSPAVCTFLPLPRLPATAHFATGGCSDLIAGAVHLWLPRLPCLFTIRAVAFALPPALPDYYVLRVTRILPRVDCCGTFPRVPIAAPALPRFAARVRLYVLRTAVPHHTHAHGCSCSIHALPRFVALLLVTRCVTPLLHLLLLRHYCCYDVPLSTYLVDCYCVVTYCCYRIIVDCVVEYYCCLCSTLHCCVQCVVWLCVDCYSTVCYIVTRLLLLLHYCDDNPDCCHFNALWCLVVYRTVPCALPRSCPHTRLLNVALLIRARYDHWLLRVLPRYCCVMVIIVIVDVIVIPHVATHALPVPAVTAALRMTRCYCPLFELPRICSLFTLPLLLNWLPVVLLFVTLIIVIVVVVVPLITRCYCCCYLVIVTFNLLFCITLLLITCYCYFWCVVDLMPLLLVIIIVVDDLIVIVIVDATLMLLLLLPWCYCCSVLAGTTFIVRYRW